jgi:hypothetical protein
VNRRILVTTAVLGTLGAGLAAPALASPSESTSETPTTICVQLPLNKPTDPRSPGYCVWIPGLAAPTS